MFGINIFGIDPAQISLGQTGNTEKLPLLLKNEFQSRLF